MSKYRKLPVEIEAFRLGYEKAPDWFKESKNIEFKREKIILIDNMKAINGITEIYINTLEGKMRANDGDYIIKGIDGEIYPCKPDIFEKTYEITKQEKTADELFKELGYFKTSCIEGFFYYNPKNNKAVLFNLYEKEWSVYDYNTLESRGYGDKLLKAILKQELQLRWIKIEDYKCEISFI